MILYWFIFEFQSYVIFESKTVATCDFKFMLDYIDLVFCLVVLFMRSIMWIVILDIIGGVRMDNITLVNAFKDSSIVRHDIW